MLNICVCLCEIINDKLFDDTVSVDKMLKYDENNFSERCYYVEIKMKL